MLFWKAFVIERACTLFWQVFVIEYIGLLKFPATLQVPSHTSSSQPHFKFKISGYNTQLFQVDVKLTNQILRSNIPENGTWE